MLYVIYNKATTGTHNTRYYKTKAAAKAQLTRMSKQGYRKSDFAIADWEHFVEYIEKQVTRKNLMTGKTYKESANTPMCCSPSSETYWSM